MLRLTAFPHARMYHMFTVSDEHIVEGRHIGIAVDISLSCYIERILDPLLSMLTRADKLTVVTFGTHTTKRTLMGDDPALRAKIHSMMKYAEEGTNLLVGLSELEGDVRFLLSDGLVNEGPLDIRFDVPIHCVSTSQSDVLKNTAERSGGKYRVFPYKVEQCVIRNTFLDLLGRKPPKYFNLKLSGPFRTYKTQAVARGGQVSVLMLTPEDGIAALTYVDEDGVEFEELCPFQNNSSLNKSAGEFLSPFKCH